MTERTEWPTADHISELRSQGQVSYSQRSAACVLLLALAITALSAPALLEEFKSFFDPALSAGGFAAVSARLRHVALVWIVVPLAISVTVVIVWGFLQTRFLFRLGLVSIDFSRLMPKGVGGVSSIVYRLSAVIASVLFASLGAFFALKVVGAQIFKILHEFSSASVQEALSTLPQLLPIVILVGAVGAVVFLLYGKLRFSMRHRMTRAQVLAERNG